MKEDWENDSTIKPSVNNCTQYKETKWQSSTGPLQCSGFNLGEEVHFLKRTLMGLLVAVIF